MRAALALSILIGVVSPIEAQIVTEMTPDKVREAIAYGQEVAAKARAGETKDFLMTEDQAFRQRFGSGALAGMRAFGWTAESLVISTPFLRVALAAADAASKRLSFEPDQVAPDVVAPVLQV